jgi:hypothetical protein
MTDLNHLFNEIGNHTETLLSRHEKDLHQVMQNLNTDDDENLQKKFKIAMNHVVTVDHFDPLRASVETKITFIKENTRWAKSKWSLISRARKGARMKADYQNCNECGKSTPGKNVFVVCLDCFENYQEALRFMHGTENRISDTVDTSRQDENESDGET